MVKSAEPTEAEIDAVVAEFGGDLRAAIRALLHDLAVLALDRALTVSRGYVRGRRLGASVESSVRSSDNEAASAGE